MSDAPKILSGQEIYDLLMSKIEPELVTDSLLTLEERFKDEPEEEKKKRLARYQEAFKEYNKIYKEYMSNLTKEVEVYSREEMERLEQQNDEREQEALTSLEASILSS